MGKLKLKGYKVKRDDGKEVIEARWTEDPVPCKGCTRNRRRQGSAFCQDCSDTKKIDVLKSNRLKRKIEQQQKTL